MKRAYQGAADVLRYEITGANRSSLPEIARRLWAAVAAGTVSETEAESLGDLLARRTAPSNDQIPSKNLTIRPPRPVRPRPTESLQRRRRWAAAGYLPPRLAHHFTGGELAALSVVAVEVGKRGSCSLTIGHIAAVAGVSETTVRRAMRQAKTLGLIEIRERRVARFRNDSNVVTVISSAWSAWLQLASKRHPPAFQKGNGTNTPINAKTCDSKAYPPSHRKREGFQDAGGGLPNLSDGFRVQRRGAA